MPITDFPDANYIPSLAGYSGQGSFRFWCQTVLPLVYDDALSYYELLNKVVKYLNNTIADVSALEGNMDNMLNAYIQLQNYVNEYFDTLDVQDEINNKLDEMADDGTLTEIFANKFPPIWVTPDMYKEEDDVDDTNCIQAALDSGYPVFFNRSLYLISNTITSDKGYVVNGNGGIIRFTGTTAVKRAINIDISTDNVNINWKGIKIDCNGIAAQGLRFDSNYNVYIENIDVYNCCTNIGIDSSAAGISVIAHASNPEQVISIKGCKVYNIYRNVETVNDVAIGCSGISTTSDGVAEIDGCGIHDVYTNSTSIYTDCDGIHAYYYTLRKENSRAVISNCTFVNCVTRDIKTQISDTQVFNCSFTTALRIPYNAGIRTDVQVGSGMVDNCTWDIQNDAVGSLTSCNRWFAKHNKFIITNCLATGNFRRVVEIRDDEANTAISCKNAEVRIENCNINSTYSGLQVMTFSKPVDRFTTGDCLKLRLINCYIGYTALSALISHGVQTSGFGKYIEYEFNGVRLSTAVRPFASNNYPLSPNIIIKNCPNIGGVALNNTWTDFNDIRTTNCQFLDVTALSNVPSDFPVSSGAVFIGVLVIGGSATYAGRLMVVSAPSNSASAGVTGAIYAAPLSTQY